MTRDPSASQPGADAPDMAAVAVSQALASRLREDILAAGGWVSFEHWMHRALYEPGLGYYSAGLRKFGPAGDFTTAPELSPFFADCVAQQIAQWFEHCDPVIVEFGAGSGELAAGVIEALQARGVSLARYAIVEVSASLRQRQRETLARLPTSLASRVQWLDCLPERIDGVVLANELLDAMPVRVFERRGQAVSEMGVGLDASGDFVWRAAAADAGLTRAVVQCEPWFSGVQPYRSEIGEQAQAWVGTVGRALERGAMLLIDYGFPGREYYHPQRAEGTLMAHRRHRAHPDVLRDPGLQDVTAHVDFSAVAQAGARAGLTLLGYTSQARFLLNCGLLDAWTAASRVPVPGEAAGTTVQHVRQLAALQTLLSEAEMGELFKVIALGRGLPDAACGFARGDRRHAL